MLPSSRIHCMLQKAPAEWTVDDLVEVFTEHELRQIALMHVGGDGSLKVLDFVPGDLNHLRRILRSGERADGSSLFPGTGIRAGSSDIVLRPRPESAFIDPFSREGTLVLLCSHVSRDGEPLPQSADTIVRRAHLRLIERTGLDLHALGEVEFFLGKAPTEFDNLGPEDRGYHAAAPFVFGETLRRRAMTILAQIGVPVKYGHSEVGYAPAERETDLIWEQHEIELALQPIPAAADSVLITQWVLMRLAQESGMKLSFEPVVRRGHAGSGMHFHLAAYQNGDYLPVLEEGARPVESAACLIAGLLRYGAALMTFGNRNASSFLRLFQGKEAPTSVTWGRFDRRALVRIPIMAADADGNPVSPDTVEFRLPDGSAFAHLLLAGIAQATCAAYEDRERVDLLERAHTRVGDDSGALPIPQEFREVVHELQRHRETLQADGVFPASFIDREIERMLAEAE